MTNTVSFKVSGSELSSYIEQIQKKSEGLTNAAIKGAIDQAQKGKDVLKIIEDQIKAVEKKNRIEQSAARSILLENREADLKKNKEKFTAISNDVFADRSLSESAKKERIQAIEGSEKESESKIKNNYREEFSIQKEIERQAKMQTGLSRESIDALKQTAKENVKAISNGDLKLADVISGAQSDDEKLVAKLTEDGLKQKKKEDKESTGTGKSLAGSLLGVDNINRLISSAGQFGSTNNGFDLIQPASNTAGRIIGGIIGGLIGTLIEPGGGTMVGAGLGASIGGGLGDAIGAFEQKRALGKEEFYKARNRFNAITGDDPTEIYDTEKSGIGATDFLKIQTDLARKMGSANGSDKVAKDVIYADRGYGVDQGTSGTLVEMMRSSKEGNKDLGVLISNVLHKGEGNIFKNGDHTFLNEFLSKFATLQKELLKAQSTVNAGTTMDILSRFNKLGGEWDSKDPRSMGNINNIQSGLSNPGTDNLKALSFSVLRRMMPNAGIFDILKERQKGLGSPDYLKGMLGAIDEIGGDDDYKKRNLSGMFPGLSLSAVERLYKNKKQLMSGSISVDELKSTYADDFQGKSEKNTSNIERTTAEIQNGILKDRYDSIEAMAGAFKTAVENTMSGAVIQLNENRGTITFPARATVIQANKTKQSAKQAEIDQIAKDMSGVF